MNECYRSGKVCDTDKYCHYSYISDSIECIHSSECVEINDRHECVCRDGFTGDGITCIGKIEMCEVDIKVQMSITSSSIIALLPSASHPPE